MNDLIQTAAEFFGDDGTGRTIAIGAATIAATESGKIIVQELVRPVLHKLRDEYRKAKTEGDIPDDFEQTPHGAALFQETLRALFSGLDQARADAVMKMFLGLAMNSVADSMGEVEQLEILKTTCELSASEVVAINALERLSNKVFNTTLANAWSNSTRSDERDQIRERALSIIPSDTRSWVLTEVCNEDGPRLTLLLKAFTSLANKGLVDGQINDFNETARLAVIRRRGVFSESGWKLVTHLYSANNE